MMENLLQNIPCVIFRVENILVSVVCEEDLLNNLEEVLKRLASTGLWVQKNKCMFMVPQVTYLGQNDSKEGIQTLQDKVDATVSPMRPRMR